MSIHTPITRISPAFCPVLAFTTKQPSNSSTDQGGGKRRSVTAFCHIDVPTARYLRMAGTTPCTVYTFDYIALGFLLASMLFAAGVVILRRSAPRLRSKTSSQARH